nr:glycosyltransferase [Sphingomonas bacterium]
MLASADVLMHGCESEAFCMTAVEARASGLPIVVPAEGGPPIMRDTVARRSSRQYRCGAAALRRILERSSQPVDTAPVRTMNDHFVTLFVDYALLGTASRAA